MALIAVDTARLLSAAGTLRGSGVGAGLSTVSLPSVGDGPTDAAMASFGRALGVRLVALDGLVESAGAVLAVYAVNVEHAGG